MKNTWYVLVVLLGSSLCVHAEGNQADDPNTMSLSKWEVVVKDASNPNELLQAKWNSLVNVLGDGTLTQKTKVILIDRLISPIFDFQLMGKLSLGKINWPKFNPDQQGKFLSLFVQRLKSSYRDKIMMYENQKTEFQPAVTDNEKAQIATTLISGEKKLAILYKLRKVDKSWKIYDVEIEGVSILLTYRSQFDDILSRGTAEDILTQLEKPAGS